MSGSASHVAVLGGGVIGIAAAHYLNRAGYRVTVIDKDRIGQACSRGNCGLVCPSHVLPLAEPGALRAALHALLKPGGAFRIRPRLDPTLWHWLWKFTRRCNRADMIASGHAIQPLLTSSMQLYEQLVQDEGLTCEWRKQGLLFVYEQQAALDAYAPVNELLAAEFDEPARRLVGEALLECEPALKSGLAGGWYFEHDAHLRPEQLLASWRQLLESRGVVFRENQMLSAFDPTQGRVRQARVSGQHLEADLFVVATGAWTPRLQELLRCPVPIEPGKGYSVVVSRTAASPELPMIFPERRVAVTPWESGVRLGSIMEFAGYDESIRPARLRMLVEGANHFLREPVAEPFDDPWYGWRPMTYDSTPVIGRCPGFENVYLATGHNMLGLSMAPATGRLLAEMIRGETPHIPPQPYRLERFL